MYHDIGYPIEKIEDISKEYLKRLMQNHRKANDKNELECKILVDTGLIMVNDNFISNYNVLIGKFIEKLCVLNDKTRNVLYDDLFNIKEIDKDNENIKKKYREDIKKKIEKLFYRALVKNADHGIFSSLLFLNAVNEGGPWNNQRNNQNHENKVVEQLTNEDMNEIALAIFSHNTLDRSKTPGNKWHLDDDFLSAHIDGKEIKFDFRVFCYNILKDTNKDHVDNWLVCLLILCDTFAQWGRSKGVKDDDKDKNMICIVPRKKEDSKVALCYPGLDKEEGTNSLKRFYAPQLGTILSKPEEKDFFCFCIKNPDGKCKIKPKENNIFRCIQCKGIDKDCIKIKQKDYSSLEETVEKSAYMHEYDKESYV